MTPAGLIATPSAFGPDETLDRLIDTVTRHGMAVLARIDHAAAAATVGLALRPTTVILFGNPRGGTPLMQAEQTIGIDLPLKALVWEDAEGRTWLGYNDPAWLAARHGINPPAVASLATMTAMLAAASVEATGSLAPSSASMTQLQRPEAVGHPLAAAAEEPG